MASGPEVPKPDKGNHPNRQVGRENWRDALASNAPAFQEEYDPNAEERAAEDRRIHPASWDW